MIAGQLVGYARVSTIEQHIDRQEKALQEQGAQKIFIDKLSGKDTNRPQFQAMLDYVRDGDTVIVLEYSRLARSTRDLLNVINELREKGVNVKSIHENFDTSTPQGELMLTFFAGIADFERKLILQRQREGIAIAKAKGKYHGRKAKEQPTDWPELYAKYRTRNMTATRLAEVCNVSRSVLYRWIRAEQQKAFNQTIHDDLKG